MLAIRMQRTGRKGHAMFRVVVQDARRTPTSGKIVAQLGSYDPHSKNIILNKEKASFYLEHGAQPSDRAARLMQAEGIKLPSWVKLSVGKERTVRNPDKRRSTRPAEPEAPSEEVAAEANTEVNESAEPATVTETEAAEAPASTEEVAENAAENDAPAA